MLLAQSQLSASEHHVSYSWENDVSRSSPSKISSSRQVIRQTLVNPCHPIRNALRPNGHLRRWEHIYPVPETRSYDMKWQSLCTPACLPLGTDYFPTKAELKEFYKEYCYTISPADELTDLESEENLLKELISQRLAQGYQLIDSSAFENIPKICANNTVSGNYSSMGSNIEKKDHTRHKKQAFFSSIPHYLSMGHHVHRLIYDPTMRNVEVKRYVRTLHYSMEPIDYRCYVWAKHRDGYEEKHVMFRYPYLSNYNWNYLDHLVAGHAEEMTDSLRYWRTRFILIPFEDVSHIKLPYGSDISEEEEEEKRVILFSKFLENFERVRIKTVQETTATQKHPLDSLGITLTPLEVSEYVRDEYKKQTGIDVLGFDSCIPNSEPYLDRTSSIATIIDSMTGQRGVKMKDRFWRKQFNNCFVASQFVDWLIRTFKDINTRDEAIDFGNELMDNDVIEHCTRKHRFMDGLYFFRLKEDMKIQRSSRFSFLKTAMRIGNEFSKKEDSSSLRGDSVSVTYEENLERTIALTKRVNINIDLQRRSGRREHAVLHYSTIHNIRNCYHFQLNWLNCTARLIEDMLQTWGRNAERVGLRLVEAPLEQAQMEQNDNVFQTSLEIRLADPPPSIDKLKQMGIKNADAKMRSYFLANLATHFGFILDLEADSNFPEEAKYSFLKTEYVYTQYVHRSGAAFLQLRDPDCGFLFANNRLLNSHIHLTQSTKSMSHSHQLAGFMDADCIRRRIQEFCYDQERLQRFWVDCVKCMQVDAMSSASVSSANSIE